ncbi:MAG: hypothetical protein HYR96_00610 [Deltaproteobacteria bacterium]|nr:hypothetical protein [Deltaproteobacteria bacterium]MBI3294002.1 hypothetical protein [Deltaproteobacteria bacterium]
MFQESSNNELQIVAKALSYFKTHWWIYLLEVAIIYGASLHTFYSTPSVFESTGSLLIDSSRRQLYQSVMMQGGSFGGNSRKQNLVQLLTSNEVLERMRNSLIEHFQSEGKPAHLRLFFPNGTAYPAEFFRKFVNLTWDRGSDIYGFRCTAQNAMAAHSLCKVFMDTVQNYYPEIGSRESVMKREFLSRQIESLKRQLAERESNLIEFAKRNEDFVNFMLLKVEGHGIEKVRADLGDLKQKRISNRALRKLMMESPQAKRGEHSTYSNAITALTARVSELSYQIYLTKQSNAPDRDERLKKAEDDLQNASNQLASLNEAETKVYLKNPLQAQDVRKRMTEAELELSSIDFRIAALENEMTEVQQKEKKYQSQRHEYDRLNVELTHKRRLLANLYEKEQVAEIEVAAGNAEIFRLAEPSQNPFRVAPILSKHLYGSLSFSLFAVILTTLLLMVISPRIDSETDANRLNLPILGKIPYMRPQQGESFIDLSNLGLEYFKIMNYRILRETKDIRCPVVIVSSPHAREGKSTVAQSLAIASQSPSKNSLLIDGDLITSHPNSFFGFKEDHTLGMRSVLNDTQLPQSQSIIIKSIHEGVSFLPRGGRIDPVAMPNYLKPIERFIEQMRKEYDIIYIDTPPLFASNLAHQWCGIADLVVLVARVYLTRPKDMLEAIQTCKVFSKAPVGVALNCLPVSAQQKRASNYYFSRRRGGTAKLAA